MEALRRQNEAHRIALANAGDSFKFASLRKIVLRDMFGAYLFKDPTLQVRDPDGPVLAPDKDLMQQKNRLERPSPHMPARPPFLHYEDSRRETVIREIWHEFNDVEMNGKKIFANITQRTAFLAVFFEKVSKAIAAGRSVDPAVFESAKNVKKDYETYKHQAHQDIARLAKTGKADMAQLTDILSRVVVTQDDPRMRSLASELLALANEKRAAKSLESTSAAPALTRGNTL
jgi:hypothetical protein